MTTDEQALMDAAIQLAKVVEREACANILEEAAKLWPDNPLVIRVLLASAADIRKRHRNG